ncbi:lipopolysaccharide biosynthesis protein [Polaribacter sp. Hel1_85]|uniref:lipopolysaccharide biosynthesis protein n=1 Tax=Polaribacter sp. Hel1_85 TaxID=1250005 RepID=UPI00052C2231|nr:oligosaccharide flippase family protein [Polaribacter sp. Hel1_85]KGL64359.1 polysaccharide biosynthesis protein [Polaribacter sp. Hel1_85]
MKKHINNFLLNTSPFFVALLPSIFAIPIYLKTIGTEGLGMYYLYLATVGIGGTFDFGIPQTVIKYVAQYKLVSKKFVNLTILSTRLIILLTSFVLTIISILLCLIIAYSNLFYNLEIIWVVFFSIGLILQIWFNFFLSILKGYEKFKDVAKIEILNKLIFTGFGILLAFLYKDVKYVILSHIFALLIQNIFLYKKLTFSKKKYSFKFKIEFFKRNLWLYSKWILIQNTIGFLNNNIDKFIVASFINLNSLAVYNTAKNIANILPAFFSKGLSYLLPHVAGIKNKESIRGFYLKYSYIFNSILAFLYILGVLVSVPFFPFYLKGDIELSNQVISVFRFLLISSVFTSTSLLSFNLYNGMGEVKINTILPLITNSFSILFIFICGYYYGLWGGCICQNE